MIIDDKGRLFKKINLIDLLIILIVIAAGVFVFGKFSKAKIVTPFTKQEQIVVTFYSESIPDYAAEAMQIGDFVKDKASGNVVGKIIEKETGPDISYERDATTGNMIRSSREGYCNLKIKVEGSGLLDEYGATINNVELYVYKYLDIRAGKALMYARISDVYKK
jgi:hypothetical protein